MGISQIGINYSRLQNLTPPSFNFTNYSKQEFIEQIPAQANSLTGDYFGIIVLLFISIFLFWVLTEKTNYGFFRYSQVRGLGISLGIVCILGLQMITIGYITNYIHLGMLMALYTLMIIYTILKNPD